MEMDLVKQELDMHTKQFKQEGYIILKEFFPKEYIENFKSQAQKVFQIQFDKFGYKGTFNENMIQLFEEQESIFINCGKIIQQGLLELYKLPLEDKLISTIKELGISFPNLCTRPVLFFNHPKLAKDKVYYKTPPHQDWNSMQSSLDSIVVWVPLVNVDDKNGSIIIYPGTHKLGPLPYTTKGGFASVKVDPSWESIQPHLEIGDICIFSTLLVHESGDIVDDSIRWSCHYRYTNMHDPDFIERGFPNPYSYKPLIQQ